MFVVEIRAPIVVQGIEHETWEKERFNFAELKIVEGALVAEQALTGKPVIFAPGQWRRAWEE